MGERRLNRTRSNGFIVKEREKASMSKHTYRIVEVDAENIDDIGLYCSRSKQKEEGYQRKVTWIKDRFKEGLEYRVLLVDEGRKDLAYRGMIEFMPGKHCWRGINAPQYMVIHCIWVIGRHKNKGYATLHHINAVKKFGFTPLHRKTFLSNILNKSKEGIVIEP